jgi:hypothetical protein
LRILSIESIVPNIKKVLPRIKTGTNIILNAINNAINIVMNWDFPMAVIINQGKIISIGTGGEAYGTFVKTFKGAEAFLGKGETITVFNCCVNSHILECVVQNTFDSVVIAPEFSDFERGYISRPILDNCALLRINGGNFIKLNTELNAESIKTITIKEPISTEEKYDIELAVYISSLLPDPVIFVAGGHTCGIFGNNAVIHGKLVTNNLTWEEAIVAVCKVPLTREVIEGLKDIGVKTIVLDAAINDNMIIDQMVKSANTNGIIIMKKS